jgi:hypothetical protein
MLPQSAVREGVSEVNSRDSMPPLHAKNDRCLSSDTAAVRGAFQR